MKKQAKKKKAPETKTGIIYRAYDKDGRSYIGATTVGLEKRRQMHHTEAKNNPGGSFHQAIRDGVEFKWEVLEYCNPKSLPELESWWMGVFDSIENGYNTRNSFYRIFHKDYGFLAGTATQLAEAIGAHYQQISAIFSGRCKHAGGWVDASRVDEYFELTKHQPSQGRGLIHSVINSRGEVFTGTQAELVRRLGLCKPNFSCLISGKLKTHRGFKLVKSIDLETVKN